MRSATDKGGAFLNLEIMKCRSLNLITPCNYITEGITSIALLDFDDFVALKFEDDSKYDTSYVTAILREGDFIELDAPISAKYTSTLNAGIYTHKLETSIKDLSKYFSRNLHLATKRRYIVMFRAKNGRDFLFGYDTGALLSYANQTEEFIGSVVVLTASTIYQLFEVEGEASNNDFTAIYQIDSLVCEEKLFIVDLATAICEDN